MKQKPRREASQSPIPNTKISTFLIEQDPAGPEKETMEGSLLPRMYPQAWISKPVGRGDHLG